MKFFGVGVPLTGEGKYLQPAKEPEMEEEPPKEVNGKESLVFDGVKFFGLGVPLVGAGKFLPDTQKDKTEEKPEESSLNVLEEPLRVRW